MIDKRSQPLGYSIFLTAITAFAVSADRSMVVSCEITSRDPYFGQVSVYDLHSKSGIFHCGASTEGIGGHNVKRSGYTSCAIDTSHRRVALLTPHWEDPKSSFSERLGTHILFCEAHGESLSLLGQLSVPLELTQITFCPYDPQIFCVTGKNNFMRLFKHNAITGELRQFPEFQGGPDQLPNDSFIVSHIWYGPMPTKSDDEEDEGGNTGDRSPRSSSAKQQLLKRMWAKQKELLILNHSTREVYLVDAQTLKVIEIITECFHHTLSDKVKPLSIAVFQRGFIVAGTEGYLAIWERLDAKSYRFVRNLYTGKKSNIVSVDIIVDDELFFGKDALAKNTALSQADSSATTSQAGVVLAYANGNIGYLNLANLYLAKGQDDLNILASDKMMNSHTGAILGLSCSTSDLRPFFGTCAGSKEDSSIRIYNYKTLCLEQSTYFPLEKSPVTISMHPEGYSCAAGFTDGNLRLFHILSTKLQIYREYKLTAIRKVKYSHGGHLLAVCFGKFIALFSTVTHEKLVTLKKHAVPVIDICFDFQDSVLASISMDGAMYLWDLCDYSRAGEYFCEPHKECTDGNGLLELMTAKSEAATKNGSDASAPEQVPSTSIDDGHVLLNVFRSRHEFSDG